MNSSQRPPSDTPRTGSEVEAGFERLLKDAMTRRLRAAAGSECIDAETLAAWCDGALPPSERSFVEAHAARCARCQDMLAVMARTAPVETGRAPWALRHWIMMLAPAATATAAVALWFAIEPRRPASQPPAPQVAVAENKEAVADDRKDVSADTGKPSLTDAASARRLPASPAETPRPQSRDEREATDRVASAKEVDQLRRRVAESKDADRFQRASKVGDLAKTEAMKQEVTAALGEEKRRIEPPAGPPPQSVTASLPAVASPPVQERPATPPPPPPPPTPARPAADPAQPVAQTPVGQTQQAPTQQAARADSAQADTQARSVGGGAVAGGRGAGTLNRSALNEAVGVAVVAGARSDAGVQWRAIAGRIIQHTVDKGATWATQYTLDDTAVIVAGSAPTSTAAWFVGRAGLVVSTADGRTWRRVAFPEAIDLVSVLATDARTAIVTAEDRRVFTTTDGGASWSAGKN